MTREKFLEKLKNKSFSFKELFVSYTKELEKKPKPDFVTFLYTNHPTALQMRFEAVGAMVEYFEKKFGIIHVYSKDNDLLVKV